MKSLFKTLFKNDDTHKQEMINKINQKEEFKKNELLKRNRMLKQLALLLPKFKLNSNEILIVNDKSIQKREDISNLTLENQYRKCMSFDNLDLSTKYLNSIEYLKQLISRVNNLKKYTQESTIDYKLLVSIMFGLTSLKENLHTHADYISKHSASIKKGFQGESLVKQNLLMHETLNVLDNITLEDKISSSHAQCDSIIICEKGVFILEIKNYASEGSYSIKIDNTGLWTKKIGNNIEKMDSASVQNDRHIAICNSIIKKHLNMSVYSKSIIVIANQTATVVNESIENIVRPELIYNIISNSPTIFTADQVNEITNVLKTYSTDEKKYPILNLQNEMNDDFTNYLSYVNSILSAIERTYRW